LNEFIYTTSVYYGKYSTRVRACYSYSHRGVEFFTSRVCLKLSCIRNGWQEGLTDGPLDLREMNHCPALLSYKRPSMACGRKTPFSVKAAGWDSGHF
jgi:hypothetical protein